jgi:MarR family 2-MHQ and catechol resistance regulon transcriptional repressor
MIMNHIAGQDLFNTQIVEQLFITTALLRKAGDNRIFKRFGLTTGLFSVLIKIAAGKNSSSELQEYVEGTPASLTQKLKQLEEEQIITRRFDEKDKRRWIFDITEKGHRVLAEIQPVYEAQLLGLFEDYDEGAKSRFLEFLKELEERLRR